jgi:hypothetical protein
VNTYNDTYPVIIKEQYINSYKIYNGEDIEINLSKWRVSTLLYKTSWRDIFKQQYDVDWGTHKWINVTKDYKWFNTVFFNVTANYIMDEEIFKKYGDKLCLLSPDPTALEKFQHLNKKCETINFHCPKTFEDLCVAVNSCKLLLGGLSGVLTIGHATHKDREILLVPNVPDNAHNMGFDAYWNNVYYNYCGAAH